MQSQNIDKDIDEKLPDQLSDDFSGDYEEKSPHRKEDQEIPEDTMTALNARVTTCIADVEVIGGKVASHLTRTKCQQEAFVRSEDIDPSDEDHHDAHCCCSQSGPNEPVLDTSQNTKEEFKEKGDVFGDELIEEIRG